MFPPQAGMTFTSWFCVDKFSSTSDAHPVRLLTVVRNLQGRDENLICLSVTLTSKEKSLIVSTQEAQMPNTGEYLKLGLNLKHRYNLQSYQQFKKMIHLLS